MRAGWHNVQVEKGLGRENVIGVIPEALVPREVRRQCSILWRGEPAMLHTMAMHLQASYTLKLDRMLQGTCDRGASLARARLQRVSVSCTWLLVFTCHVF